MKEMEEIPENEPIFYLDESGLSTKMPLRCAWTLKGAIYRHELQADGSKRINIIGLASDTPTILNNEKSFGFFKTFVGACTKATFMGFLNEAIFKLGIKKSIVQHHVVLDNASIHRLSNEQLRGLKLIGVTIHYLPTYCPALNLIEMLWKRLKYSDLPFISMSFEQLSQAIQDRLTNRLKMLKWRSV